MANNQDKILKNILQEEKMSFMSKVAFEARRTILKNFDGEKDVDGNNFAELEKATENDRFYNGFPKKHPILRRTGKLRNSISVVTDFNSMSWEVDSSTDYGEHLHKGRSNMKPRRILDFPEDFKEGGKSREKIFNQFDNNLKTRVSEVIQELSDRIDSLLK